jgi:hypothetical protein
MKTVFFNISFSCLILVLLIGVVLSFETRETERDVREELVGKNVKVLLFNNGKISIFEKGIEINNELKVYHVESKNAYGFWVDWMDRVEIVH